MSRDITLRSRQDSNLRTRLRRPVLYPLSYGSVTRHCTPCHRLTTWGSGSVQTVSPELEMLLRVALAAVLGGAVGYDRQRSNKPAGLRTHMLVGAGSALFVTSALLAIDEFGGLNGTNLDVLRVTAAVATGIGFLGAGSILHTTDRVRGLTTAAGIWVTAGIGLAVGLGQYLLSVGATVIAVIVIALLGSEWVPEPGTRPTNSEE